MPSRPANRAPSSKPSKPLEERLTIQYRSLCAQLDGGHYRNALKTCDRILHLVPDDADAFQTKLYLLLQLELYDAALNVAQSRDTGVGFETAYCMYRLLREEDALALVEDLKASQDASEMRKVEHLDAQLAYRRASYEFSQRQYTSLLHTCPNGSDEYDDVLNNLTAAQAHLDFINTGYQDSIHRLAISITKLEASAPPVTSFVPVASKGHDRSSDAPPTKRKSRVPKHVIPGVTPLPDPERWLKKRDRAKDARKGKKGKKEGMGAGATQGSAVGVAVGPSSSRAVSGSGKKKKQGR